MRILVRLPNWLGDMVMAVAFIDGLAQAYPEARISVIAKKGIDGLLPFFPETEHRFVFDKERNNGIRGLWRFGRHIRDTDSFDLFFSLPDSFSSALMGYATGAKKRIGFSKEGRGVLLTHTYSRPAGCHRVHEYMALLERFSGTKPKQVSVRLKNGQQRSDDIVVNINSEAQSRRLTHAKAVEILSALRGETRSRILLVGAPKEAEFVESVLNALPDRQQVESLAGKTDLPALIKILGSARAMLTTDSGPAHLANALGTPTVALFGAGNENNTAPFNSEWNTVVRLNQLSCEPCLKNRCVCFETPQCLERLSTPAILQRLKQ